MSRLLRMLVLAAMITTLGGCAQLFYERTATASVTGEIMLFYKEPNIFLYVPTERNPLTFTPSKGAPVTPGPMLTDGGSVPRLFWSIPSFGPWDYGHGYVIHDWIFAAHHCGDTSVSFDDSARYLAEAMKAEMKSRKDEQPDVLWLVYEAVASNIALGLWNRPDTCDKDLVTKLVKEIKEQSNKPLHPQAIGDRASFKSVGTLVCESGTCRLLRSDIGDLPTQ